MSKKIKLDEIIDGICDLLDDRRIQAQCYKCSKKLTSEDFIAGKCGFCGPINKDAIKLTPIVLN